MDISIPTRTALKTQAKRLRASLGEQGKLITHAQSLEAIAQQYGMRDWNTLHAAAPAQRVPHAKAWQTGHRISGMYLGHPFTGKIKSVTQIAQGFWKLTVLFDTPIDVVQSEQFSNLRRQVNCTVGPDGQSVQKTSNGHPQIVIET